MGKPQFEELPYTYDFKKEQVVEYNSRNASDPFMSFFKAVLGYKWSSQNALRQFEEAMNKLSMALTIPLIDQAKFAATNIVTAFVWDTTYSVRGGRFSETTFKQMGFDARSLKIKLTDSPHELSMFKNILRQRVIQFESEDWPKGYSHDSHWMLAWVESYRREMPTYALEIGSNLSAYGIIPELGRFWVVYPRYSLRKHPQSFLYFQVLTDFVYLGEWE